MAKQFIQAEAASRLGLIQALDLEERRMKGMLFSIVVLAAGVFAIVRIFMRSKATIIKLPTVSFLDLSRGEFAEQLVEDKRALGALFESTSESNSKPLNAMCCFFTVVSGRKAELKARIMACEN
jgi:hypothetical protein